MYFVTWCEKLSFSRKTRDEITAVKKYIRKLASVRRGNENNGAKLGVVAAKEVMSVEKQWWLRYLRRRQSKKCGKNKRGIPRRMWNRSIAEKLKKSVNTGLWI